MLVSEFMIPVDNVVKCTEWDPILAVVENLAQNNISAVVVIGNDDKPVGLVTKTDLVAAYKQSVPLHQRVGLIMRTSFPKVLDTTPRDNAAKAFEHSQHHHALVFDQHETFVGIISTWDIAAECARDARAWPWTRTADGKVIVH